MSEGGFNPEFPVEDPEDFYGINRLSHLINTGLSEGRKFTFLLGRPKSGKTSITNVLPKVIEDGFIPIPFSLDLLGPNPSFSMYTQVFNSIFRALIKRQILDTDDKAYLAWARQVNRGDLGVDLGDEILAIGSRIAFYLNNPGSPITIDTGLIESDWERLFDYVKSKYPDFHNFVFIIDNPNNLLLVDDQTRNSFLRVFKTNKSPLMICTLEIPNDPKLGDSLVEFFRKSISEEPNLFGLPLLNVDNIIDLLQKTHPELDQDSLIRIARRVYSITREPYLVKSLLEIAALRTRSSDIFTISSEDCFELINSQKANLASSDIEKLKLLESIHKEDKALFMTAVKTVLAVSDDQRKLRSRERHTRQLKTPKQIVLNSHAPEGIYENEITSEIQTYVSQLRRLWNLGLFTLVDGDGQTIDSKIYSDNNLITEDSNLSADTHPLILSYLQIAAKEIQSDFKSPSSQGYFKNTSTKFALDLVRFITQSQDRSEFDQPFIRGNETKSRASSPVEGLANVIRDAVQLRDHNSFTSYFALPIQAVSRQNRFFSNDPEVVHSYFVLTLLFSERNFPETSEFIFLMRMPSTSTTQLIGEIVDSWIEIKSIVMELGYSIQLVDKQVLEISNEFLDEVRFLSTRSDRGRLYMNLFQKGDFEQLEHLLIPDLNQELVLSNQLGVDSEIMKEFRSDLAQRMGYMATCCGHFSLALDAFKVARKTDFSAIIMIEDDKLVANAYLGNLEEAITISNEILRMLRTKGLGDHSYWKLFYSPLESFRLFKGSASFELSSWTMFAYELQHAILLLEKKAYFALTDAEIEFLQTFSRFLELNPPWELVYAKQPLHRVLASYFKLNGQSEQALVILQQLNDDFDMLGTLQWESSRSDLLHMKTGEQNG